MKKDIIRLFAELMADTQAPRSMGVIALGKGIESWDQIKDQLNMFGWRDADDYEKALRNVLEVKAVDELPQTGGTK